MWQSTWMCCTWALNPVHAKMKTPIFYSEIVAESVRFYYWMMNAHTQHRRHHCYPDDDSKLCYWNWKQYRWRKTENRRKRMHKKMHSKELNIIYRTATISNEAVNNGSKCGNSVVIHMHLFITYWNFPIGIRSSSIAISSLVCSMIFMYFSIDVCIKFFPMKWRFESGYSLL